MNWGALLNTRIKWLLAAVPLVAAVFVVLVRMNRNAPFHRLMGDCPIIWAVTTSGTDHRVQTIDKHLVRSARLFKAVAYVNTAVLDRTGFKLLSPVEYRVSSLEPTMTIYVRCTPGFLGSGRQLSLVLNDKGKKKRYIVCVVAGLWKAADIENYTLTRWVKCGVGQEIEFFVTDSSGKVSTTAKPVARLKL
jgi:hypothetical protein